MALHELLQDSKYQHICSLLEIWSAIVSAHVRLWIWPPTTLNTGNTVTVSPHSPPVTWNKGWPFSPSAFFGTKKSWKPLSSGFHICVGTSLMFSLLNSASSFCNFWFSHLLCRQIHWCFCSNLCTGTICVTSIIHSKKRCTLNHTVQYTVLCIVTCATCQQYSSCTTC